MLQWLAYLVLFNVGQSVLNSGQMKVMSSSKMVLVSKLCRWIFINNGEGMGRRFCPLPRLTSLRAILDEVKAPSEHNDLEVYKRTSQPRLLIVSFNISFQLFSFPHLQLTPTLLAPTRTRRMKMAAHRCHMLHGDGTRL